MRGSIQVKYSFVNHILLFCDNLLLISIFSEDSNAIVRLLTGDDNLRLAQSKDSGEFAAFDQKFIKSVSEMTTISVKES